MKTLVFDCESTIYEQGNPFSIPNRLMCVGTLFDGNYEHHDIEYSGLPYNRSIERLTQIFSEAELVIGFNLKYDLHWIRKYLPRLHLPNLYCAQLVEFILANQRLPYPSLDNVATSYDLGVKLDRVRTEYWDNGIDTDCVPSDILNEYLKRDVELTYEVYLKQLNIIQSLPKNRQALIRLHNADLGTLAEAEYNGMYFDSGEASRLAGNTQKELDGILTTLVSLDPSYSHINFNSPDHLSAILYGGGINLPCMVSTSKILKSGEVKTREVKGYRTLEFPRLVKPLDKTESKPTDKWNDDELSKHNRLQQESRKPLTFRTYYTNQDVLRSLTARGKGREIIRLLLLYADLDSLLSKGYIGIPKLQAKMKWKENLIHGQFNQCVAVTGRLSSSKPNLQNFAGTIKPLFYTRFS